MNPNILLLLNLALSFYLVGAIWAHEIDIFQVLEIHWRRKISRRRPIRALA